MRDDFTLQTKDLLAKRVGYRCSNPGCRQATSGPRSDPEKSINVGFAAHISAAASGGPRYDEALSPEQRRHAFERYAQVLPFGEGEAAQPERLAAEQQIVRRSLARRHLWKGEGCRTVAEIE